MSMIYRLKNRFLPLKSSPSRKSARMNNMVRRFRLRNYVPMD
jgi:hypothetical protein